MKALFPFRVLHILAVLLAGILACAWNQAQEKSDEHFDSPRLATLAQKLKTGHPEAVPEFWAEVKGKAPLVEPIPKDEHHVWVTYLHQDTGKAARIGLIGGMPTGEEMKYLTRLPGTDVWYRTEKVPTDARYTYVFLLDPPKVLPKDEKESMKLMGRMRFDPLNPRNFRLRPLADLPAAPPQTDLERKPGVPQGKVIQHKMTSTILKQERFFAVYTPAGYEGKGEPLPLVVLFDGLGYQFEIPTPIILDNLIAQKKLPPLLAVFVSHKDRVEELSCSETFGNYVATELVPWMRKEYHATADPSRTVVGGLSLGGLMAAYCGLKHSDVFGNVLSQSGSFWWYPNPHKTEQSLEQETGWLTRQFVTAPRYPVRFYLEVGRFEAMLMLNQVAENRRLRDVLEAKGYSVVYSEYNGGHDTLNWRGTLAQGLIALLVNLPKE
jgi:enterochelin esterase-like enzyme